MNLNTVYELRDRLEAAAIAGTGLIREDFRLKRAAEQIGPLAAASPVFKKIQAMALKLTAEEAEDRAGLLLDTLALLDAVLCTQGALEAPGEITPLKDSGRGAVCKNLAYSRIAPLLEAFQGTGGGRYAVIRDCHDEDPELFEDFRVKRLMIQGLSDSYGELADMVMEWLKEEGASVTEPLKQNFDPRGRRPMARRVEILDAAAGAAENEFYRSLLQDSSREVKEAAIRALRHDPANDALLLDLAKTEKGKMKETIYGSLACMNSAPVQEFWTKAMARNPSAIAGYLAASQEDWASDLIADQLMYLLEHRAEGTEEDGWREKLEQVWQGASGKHSDRLLACYEPVFRVLDKLVSETLTDSVLCTGHPSFRPLVRELYRTYGDSFLESAFLDALIYERPEKVYEDFQDYFEKGNLIKEKLFKSKKNPRGIIDALSRVAFNENTGRYVLYILQPFNTPLKELPLAVKQPEGLDLRWYHRLLHYQPRFSKEWRDSWHQYDSFYDEVAAGLYRGDSEELRREYGNYFYKSAMYYGPSEADVKLLIRCGWTDFKNFLTAAVRQTGSSRLYRVRSLLSVLPLSDSEKADELDQIIRSLGKKEAQGAGLLERWRDELRKEEL